MRLWLLGLLAFIAACGFPSDESRLRPENNVTWVTVRGDQVPVLRVGTAMHDAAIAIQRRWPTLAAAQSDESTRWFAAHPENGFVGAFNADFLPHGELAGFGATLVLTSNADAGAFPGPGDFPPASGVLTEPTLLFYDMRAGPDHRTWPIIGMGYAFPYEDVDGDNVADPPVILSDELRPRLRWNFAESSFFFRDGFLTHEAGYHLAGLGAAFDIADNADLTGDATDSGLFVDLQGLLPISHEHMKDRGPDQAKHGRFFTIHVFFEPGTGRPTVAPCDPWGRYSDNAVAAPAGSFYYRDGVASRARVFQQCTQGGGYPTITALAPD